MSRENRYRVWCEFTVGGKKFTTMAGPENWFLLTQTGHLMSHGPIGRFNPNVKKRYDKLIIEFWTGKQDSKGQDIYEEDLILVTAMKHTIDGSYIEQKSPFKALVFWNETMGCWFYEELEYPEGGHPLANCKCDVIGSVHSQEDE